MNYWVIPGIKKLNRTKTNVLNEVCVAFGINRDDVLGKRRFRTFSDARTMLAWMLHKKMEYTSVEVGKFMNLDHATILHHCKKAECLIDYDKQFILKYEKLKMFL